MNNLVECYTLNATEATHGIQADEYDSIISDVPTVKFASVTLVPILGDKTELTLENAALSVSFVHGYSECDTADKGGIVLSFDPAEWRLTTDKTHLILLDPAGVNGKALLYIERSSAHVLENAFDKTMYFSVDKAGNPCVQRHSRAAMMLTAILGTPELPAAATAHKDTSRRGVRGRPRAAHQD